MTTEMKKVWFVDGQIIEQEIPESAIYKRAWDVASCKAYAAQLRDKTRANTAEHAAEAIEYLLAELANEPYKPDWSTEAVLVEEMQRMAKVIEDQYQILRNRAEQIVSLQDEIKNLTGEQS